MHRIIRTKAYEAKHGPHFDEEHARKAVSKMENEDGSRGQHWSVEETSALANQYGIRFDSKFNKYDWYVALNMVYSDYYKVIVNMTGSNNSKYFVELAKAWICDKDIDEGKMWYYYIYVMCDKLRDAEEEYFDRNYSKYEDEDDDDDEPYGTYRRGGRMGRSSYGRRREYDREYDLEIIGTFKKSTNYFAGNIVSVSKVYDEPLPPQQFPMPNQNRKKLVDIVISCGGEQKKLTVEEGKSLINDTQLGLTVATDKQHIVNMVKSSYNEYKAKKEAVARYDEEMTKCEAILKQLDYTEKEPEKEDPRIQELQDQVRELKDLIKQASNMVPPQMKQMLPQNMQKAMNEAS